MNRQSFTQLVKDYKGIPGRDRDELHELAHEYPYSQIIHTLVAKSHHDAKSKMAKQTLSYAAMYATDRAVLKQIIQSGPEYVATEEAPGNISVPKVSKTEPASKIQPLAKTEDIENAQIFSQQDTVDDKITIDIPPHEKRPWREEILQDLDKLKISKANYEAFVEKQMAEKSPVKTKETSIEKIGSKTPAKRKVTAVKKAKAEKEPTTVKNKTTKKSTDGEPNASITKIKAEPKSKPTQKKTPAASTKKKDKPTQTEHIKSDDQHKIIDKFIKKEPSITAKATRKNSTNTEDLSQTSTTFNEELISENLANILVGQGKTGKAIDIYKKLIWKFPQKKAYFAAQIEKLKS